MVTDFLPGIEADQRKEVSDTITLRMAEKGTWERETEVKEER